MDKQLESIIARHEATIARHETAIATLNLSIERQRTAQKYEERYSKESLNKWLDRLEGVQEEIREIDKLRHALIKQQSQLSFLKWIVTAILLPLVLLAIERFW